jgi:hypothetical protein
MMLEHFQASETEKRELLFGLALSTFESVCEQRYNGDKEEVQYMWKEGSASVVGVNHYSNPFSPEPAATKSKAMWLWHLELVKR